MIRTACLTLLVALALGSLGSAAAQPIRDVPGTEPAPVPDATPMPSDQTRVPPEQTQSARERSGNALLAPPRDRSGGATDAGPIGSTPYSGVPERGDAATGGSALGR